MTLRIRISLVTALMTSIALIVAPGTLQAGHHLAGEAEAAGEEAAAQIESAEKTMEDTYEADREAGRGHQKTKSAGPGLASAAHRTWFPLVRIPPIELTSARLGSLGSETYRSRQN